MVSSRARCSVKRCAADTGPRRHALAPRVLAILGRFHPKAGYGAADEAIQGRQRGGNALRHPPSAAEMPLFRRRPAAVWQL